MIFQLFSINYLKINNTLKAIRQPTIIKINFLNMILKF